MMPMRILFFLILTASLGPALASTESQEVDIEDVPKDPENRSAARPTVSVADEVSLILQREVLCRVEPHNRTKPRRRSGNKRC